MRRECGDRMFIIDLTALFHIRLSIYMEISRSSQCAIKKENYHRGCWAFRLPWGMAPLGGQVRITQAGLTVVA
jgi:hypothetical protein